MNTCPQCRKVIREWALAWRRAKQEGSSPRLTDACLRTAVNWRNGECILHGWTEPQKARDAK